MRDLHSLIGEEISALIPFFHPTKLQILTLHGVENGGIWVENQKYTNQFLESIGLATAPKTMIFFLPWHQIATILGSLETPSLSEKAFDV